MKKIIATIVLSLVMSTMLYAAQSPKGGSVLKGEGFKIDVPTFDVKVKQGEAQTIDIQLKRGDSFKQDVTLEIKLSKGEGLTFDPAKIDVKAGDKADLQFIIKAPKDAVIGDYTILVTGTPTAGEATSVEFGVEVVTPEAGYTMKSNSAQGGGTAKGEGFKISVPAFETKVKQGETQSIAISLKRDDSFKQDVKLDVKLAKGKGLILDPAVLNIKAGDKADAQILVKVPKDAAIGDYKVTVTATPTTGAATSTEFKVKVVSPKDAGFTMKSNSPEGGSALKGEGFKIGVPFFDTNIEQGGTKSIAISLKRGDSFKQDVTLEFKLFKGEGLTFEPAKILVKASDKPDVQIAISVPKDAAIGDYKVSIVGTPATGETTSTEVNVKVVAP